MRGLRLKVALGVLVCGVVAAAGEQVKPVVTVAQNGTGEFRTVQAAVEAAPAQGEVIKIAAGVYREKLSIAKDGVELRGVGSGPADVVLSWDDTHGSAGGTGKSASVTVTGDDFVAENLTIENLWEKTHARTQEGSQAVALYVTGDREVLRDVRLLGYQDTLYAASRACHAPEDAAEDRRCQASRMLFEDCYISGHVDFIFGDAKAVFDRCTIHAMAHPEVTITAQSKLYPEEDSGYLFLDCTITAEPASKGQGVGELLLGRPWRAYSTVEWVNTKVVGTKIAAAGWAEWDGRLKTSTYGEYATVGEDGKAVDTSGWIAGATPLTKAEAAKMTVKGWLEGWDAEARANADSLRE